MFKDSDGFKANEEGKEACEVKGLSATDGWHFFKLVKFQFQNSVKGKKGRKNNFQTTVQQIRRVMKKKATRQYDRLINIIFPDYERPKKQKKQTVTTQESSAEESNDEIDLDEFFGALSEVTNDGDEEDIKKNDNPVASFGSSKKRKRSDVQYAGLEQTNREDGDEDFNLDDEEESEEDEDSDNDSEDVSNKDSEGEDEEVADMRLGINSSTSRKNSIKIASEEFQRDYAKISKQVKTGNVQI